MQFIACFTFFVDLAGRGQEATDINTSNVPDPENCLKIWRYFLTDELSPNHKRGCFACSCISALVLAHVFGLLCQANYLAASTPSGFDFVFEVPVSTAFYLPLAFSLESTLAQVARSTLAYFFLNFFCALCCVILWCANYSHLTPLLLVGSYVRFHKNGRFKNSNHENPHHYPEVTEDASDPHDHYGCLKKWILDELHDADGRPIKDCNGLPCCFLS